MSATGMLEAALKGRILVRVPPGSIPVANRTVANGAGRLQSCAANGWRGWVSVSQLLESEPAIADTAW
jgi:hypothetical protein